MCRSGAVTKSRVELVREVSISVVSEVTMVWSDYFFLMSFPMKYPENFCIQ